MDSVKAVFNRTNGGNRFQHPEYKQTPMKMRKNELRRKQRLVAGCTFKNHIYTKKAFKEKQKLSIRVSDIL